MANIVAKRDVPAGDLSFRFAGKGRKERLDVKATERLAVGKDASGFGFDRNENGASRLLTERAAGGPAPTTVGKPFRFGLQ